MASDLLSIAVSGARAARGALDVTAQNIANASSDGYVRRSVRIEEVSGGSIAGRGGDVSVSGSRIAQVRRNADAFRQAELRRTNADLQRANVELGGLQNTLSFDAVGDDTSHRRQHQHRHGAARLDQRHQVAHLPGTADKGSLYRQVPQRQ